MKIEILETFLHSRDRFEIGEVRVVNDKLGEYFCSNGWAKDLDGGVKTAPRDIHRTVMLDMDVASHIIQAENVHG